MGQIITPVFIDGNLPRNAGELCGCVGIERATLVPVAGFTIKTDDQQRSFRVEEGRYSATAIYLFYQMAKIGQREFALAPEMRTELVLYFGTDLVSKTSSRDHVSMLLDGNDVHISLALKPGYDKHLVTHRTVEEVIRQAWSVRNTISPAGRHSFLNRAIDMLFADIDAGKILMTETDADGWPSMDWCDRAFELQQRLTNEPVPA
jgi:hypothetical protein